MSNLPGITFGVLLAGSRLHTWKDENIKLNKKRKNGQQAGKEPMCTSTSELFSSVYIQLTILLHPSVE